MAALEALSDKQDRQEPLATILMPVREVQQEAAATAQAVSADREGSLSDVPKSRSILLRYRFEVVHLRNASSGADSKDNARQCKQESSLCDARCPSRRES